MEPFIKREVEVLKNIREQPNNGRSTYIEHTTIINKNQRKKFTKTTSIDKDLCHPLIGLICFSPLSFNIKYCYLFKRILVILYTL